jgi:hypothetical protein
MMTDYLEQANKLAQMRVLCRFDDGGESWRGPTARIYVSV